MNRIKPGLLALELFLACTFPSFLLWTSLAFSRNISDGLAMIFILAILTGILIPHILVSWLVIFLTTIGSGALLFGYIVMPTEAKIILLIAFPVEAFLVSNISHYLIHWSYAMKNRKAAVKYFHHYNAYLKLQTEYNANKLYNKEINSIKNRPEYNLFTSATMIRWDQHEQFAQFHHADHQKTLKQMAKCIKQSRLSEEFIYYLDDATFLIISPNIPIKYLNMINQETQQKIKELDAPIVITPKIATQKIDEENVEKFSSFDTLCKHLERGLETSLIVEYLKDENFD